MNSELLQILIILYIISAFALLFNNSSNKYHLASLYAFFVAVFAYGLYIIELERINKKKNQDKKDSSQETVNQPLESINSNNEESKENYLCNYNDNPQCYTKECKGFGMNGRPFEFEYTPETDFNWKWNRC